MEKIIQLVSGDSIQNTSDIVSSLFIIMHEPSLCSYQVTRSFANLIKSLLVCKIKLQYF